METLEKEPILYVDDEPENLQGFNYLMRREFQVYLASSATQAIDILRNNTIKVILSDQRMPETTGIELLEKIIDEFPDIIRIIVTAYSDAETILQSINFGKIYHFIIKPWNNNELNIVLRRAVETYNLKRDKLQLVNFLQKANLELAEAKEKAEESDRLKTSFLANISHEIRTPLNAIVGFSNLLINNPVDQEMSKQFVNIIETSSNDLLNIIEDILDTSRIESGVVALNHSIVDIHKLMSDLLLIFQNHIHLKENPVTLNYKYPQVYEKVSVYTDSLRLKQILSNLLNNAIKFTEKGEIEMGFTIIENSENPLLQFYIKDTGVGIPQDKIDLIFERFHKIEIDENKLYRGNGLGLYIARKLAQMLDGSITVKSTRGKGSTFYLTIPYVIKPVPEEKIIKGSFQFANISWPGKTILVVEDETSNYKYLEALLCNRIHILWVSNGADAVKITKDTQIDLILMDIKLPKMDGFEATRRIKKLKPEMPIIAVTAFAMEADKNECMMAGCDNYISKPFRMEELFSLITTYLN
jgi:signal transduction histidine kinase